MWKDNAMRKYETTFWDEKGRGSIHRQWQPKQIKNTPPHLILAAFIDGLFLWN